MKVGHYRFIAQGRGYRPYIVSTVIKAVSKARCTAENSLK